MHISLLHKIGIILLLIISCGNWHTNAIIKESINQYTKITWLSEIDTVFILE